METGGGGSLKPQPDTLWLPEGEYKKAFTQMRMGMPEIFGFLRVGEDVPIQYWHGFGMYIDGAIDEACRR